MSFQVRIAGHSTSPHSDVLAGEFQKFVRAINEAGLDELTMEGEFSSSDTAGSRYLTVQDALSEPSIEEPDPNDNPSAQSTGAGESAGPTA